MEDLPHVGSCPGMRYATANVALGDTPIWSRRQEAALHSHPVYMLEYVKHGRIEFEADGEGQVDLGPGAYYVMAPGLRHGHAVREDISTIHVALRPEFVRGIVAEVLPGTGLPCFPGPARQASPALDSLLRRLTAEARQPAPWRRFLVETLAAELVVQILRDHGLVRTEEQPPQEVDGVTRAIELIMIGYDRDLSLDLLAAEAGMSRFHFLRKFRERVGLTPHAYLKQIRIEQAAELLRSTDLPVTEIALRTGFAGPNRLAEAVRGAFGMAPGALRAGKQ